jgi:hypothetical protein
MHKTEMHFRIKNGATGVSIWLTVEEFENSLIEKDEIQIGNQFYDIIEIQRDGNLLRIEALHDSKEKVLKDLQNTGRGKNMLLHIAKIFSPLFLPEPPTNFNPRSFATCQQHCIVVIEPSSQFHPQETSAPPDDTF